MRRLRKLCCSAVIAGVGVVGFGAPLQAQVAESSPYYEEDGLLDITEWFDGNNYNPTDEAWWRWDNETYEAANDTSGDLDSDRDGWYGYTTRDDDDWYYDYYDPYPYSYSNHNNDIYEYWSHYYDYDNDGTYDAFASYSDSDGDGFYDDYDYYSFTDTTTSQQRQQSQQQNRESRQQEVSGKIEKTKLVKVRGGKQHVVVAIKPEQGQQGQQGQQNQQGQMVIVDLGNADDLKDLNPKLGNPIKVKGPKAQVGKQSVVLAREIELNGQTKQINRNANSFTGKVTDTHKTKVRGTEHLIAMMEIKKQDKAHKIAVDLGPADKLQMDVKKDSNLTFTGFPVKVKDKPLIVAQSIQKDDQFVQIDRQSSSPAEQAQPAGSRQQGQGERNRQAEQNQQDQQNQRQNRQGSQQ